MLSGTYLHDLTNLTILAYLVCQFFFSFFFSFSHLLARCNNSREQSGADLFYRRN